jgi:hypothetical protein
MTTTPNLPSGLRAALHALGVARVTWDAAIQRYHVGNGRTLIAPELTPERLAALISRGLAIGVTGSRGQQWIATVRGLELLRQMEMADV